MSKIIETRISQKHDFEARWNETNGFIPREGEIIVYDAETNGEGIVFVEAYMQGSSTNFTTLRTDPIPYARIKIGDGVTDVKNLEFSSSGEGGSGDGFDPTQEFVFYCGDSENLTEDPFNTAEYIVACGDADDVNDLVIPYEKDALQVHIDDKNNPHNVTADQIGAATKEYVDQKTSGLGSGNGTITGVSANGTSVATSGVANIPAASTSKYGVTKLSSATNSTSTSLAATASAVKSAYDLANTANTAASNASTTANNAMPKAGGTFTGTVTAQNNANYTTKQVRNVFLIADGASLPSGANGDICLVYTP